MVSPSFSCAAVPVLVTGGTGFLGSRLVARLLAEGRRVTVVSRQPRPELAARGVRVVTGALDDPAVSAAAVAGLAGGTVFHVAARVGVWGRAEDFHRDNVRATAALLAAARAAGVARFVHTSTPSVVYNGRPLAGADESLPLTTAALCPAAYPVSKAIAERAVLAAHTDLFRTVALRPHLIWGVGDPHLVPRVLARARAGRLRIVGDGRNRVDMVHVANAVDAHLAAEQALGAAPLVRLVLPSVESRETRAESRTSEPSPTTPSATRPPVSGSPFSALDARATPAPAAASGSAGGRAYFITNGEPVLLWEWINDLLRALGEPPVTRHLSLAVAQGLGAACEVLWRGLRLRGEPPMTRFVAKELATDHWFSIAAARRDLGYTPRVSMAEGTAELIAHLRATRG